MIFLKDPGRGDLLRLSPTAVHVPREGEVDLGGVDLDGPPEPTGLLCPPLPLRSNAHCPYGRPASTLHGLTEANPPSGNTALCSALYILDLLRHSPDPCAFINSFSNYAKV